MEAAAAPGRPRVVTIVGWVWLVMAALRFLECLIGLFIVQVGGLGQLPILPLSSDRLKFAFAGAQLGLRWAVPSLLAQIVVAGLVAWAAFALLRMKPWARKAIVAASTLGIVAAACLGGVVYISTAHIAEAAGPEAEQVRIAGMVTAGLIGVFAAAFFGLTIGLLSRPSVRRAFVQAT